MFLSTVLLLTTPKVPFFKKSLIFLSRAHSRSKTNAWSRKISKNPSVPERQPGDKAKGATQLWWVHRLLVALQAVRNINHQICLHSACLGGASLGVETTSGLVALRPSCAWLVILPSSISPCGFRNRQFDKH